MNSILKQQLDHLPSSPGVYLMKDDGDRVIYVGKAGNIRNRVFQYFNTSGAQSAKTQQLVSQINRIEFIIADSETQALIMECNLIKKYRPAYNVRLKDDKAFPYIKIDLNTEWPRVCMVRRMVKDGGKYFGPFINAGDVRRTLALIEKIFPLRNCKNVKLKLSAKPCLNYHIGRCVGPCIGAISKEEYMDLTRKVTAFLEGRQETVIKDLKSKMARYAEKHEYEKAASIRDQIRAINSIVEGQKIALSIRGDKDVIAFSQGNSIAYAELFHIHNNKLVGRNYLVIEGIQDDEPGQIMSNLLKQYYSIAAHIPPEILVQYTPDETEVISDWLSGLRGSTVKLFVPVKGIKKKLLDLVEQNAIKGMELYQIIKYPKIDYLILAKELKKALNLSKVPYRIEGYDISNLHGGYAVGSMVTFVNGKPEKDSYRKFKIKYVDGIDDYAMIQEVLRRRFLKYLSKAAKWGTPPDLILIDGGKGHLNAALEVLKKLNVEDVPTISLAKENEYVFIPYKAQPVILDKMSDSLHLLQHVRDEAHRFALAYHKNLRDRRN